MSLFVQLLLVICCHIVSLPVMLLTFCWYSLFSQCSLNNYSHCTWNKLSQILSVKAFVGVMRQNECCVTGPRGFQRHCTMSHGKTKVAVFYEIAVIWDKNTLPWFGFAFFFVCYYCNSPSPSPRITSATTQPTDYYKVAWTFVIFTIYCLTVCCHGLLFWRKAAFSEHSFPPPHIINLQYSYLFPVMLQRLSAIMPQAERTASQSASLCANAVNKNSLGSHSVDSELRWKLAGS